MSTEHSPLSTPRAALGVCAALLLATAVSAQPAAPVLQAQAFGQTIVASWTAVPGATGYRAEAGISPTQVLGAYELGALTGFSINAPQGIYYLRVFARNALGLSAPSNIVAIAVTSALAPPPPPTGVAAAVSGSSVQFSLTLPPVQLLGLMLAAGIAPGQTLTIQPLSLSPTPVIHNVPPGTYFARVHALGPGGPSIASNEVVITVPAGGGGGCVPPSAPTVSAQVGGTSVALSWTPVAGASGYQLAAAMSPGGPPVVTQPFGAGTTSAGYNGVTPGTYYVTVTANTACGAATSAAAEVVVTGGGGGTSGPRTPNPPLPSPPNHLPLPNRSAVVQEMARLYPADLRNSCVEHGGNNRWLFRLVERLRREDTRWGLNWKRARVGDMSQDVVTYNFGVEADEGTLNVYAVDVIGGHCGSNPGPTWIDQTVLWSTGAKWTLQPYLQAGYPQFPQ